jgi:hypothetical protein
MLFSPKIGGSKHAFARKFNSLVIADSKINYSIRSIDGVNDTFSPLNSSPEKSLISHLQKKIDFFHRQKKVDKINSVYNQNLVKLVDQQENCNFSHGERKVKNETQTLVRQIKLQKKKLEQLGDFTELTRPKT